MSGSAAARSATSGLRSTDCSTTSPRATRTCGATAPTSVTRSTASGASSQRQREIEEALRNTLLSAERMADELRARAHHEADLIVEEARAKAREIAASAEAEEQRVRDEIRRLRALETDVRAEFRAFLASSLERLEGDPPGRS